MVGTYSLGKERVFLALGILDMLKTKRTERMAKVCVKIQAAARGLKARKLAKRIKEARLIAQREMEAARERASAGAPQRAASTRSSAARVSGARGGLPALDGGLPPPNSPLLFCLFVLLYFV